MELKTQLLIKRHHLIQLNNSLGMVHSYMQLDNLN